MGRRRGKYSRIFQAARLQQARTQLIDYQTNAASRPAKTGAVENRPDSIDLAIDTPFNVDLAADQYIASSAFVTAWSANQASMGGRVVEEETVVGAGTKIAILGFAPARASFTTGKSATGTRQTSERTGLQYIDYGGSSLSVPFGGSTATETESEAFAAIRTAFGNAQGTSISWIREIS